MERSGLQEHLFLAEPAHCSIHVKSHLPRAEDMRSDVWMIDVKSDASNAQWRAAVQGLVRGRQARWSPVSKGRQALAAAVTMQPQEAWTQPHGLISCPGHSWLRGVLQTQAR